MLSFKQLYGILNRYWALILKEIRKSIKDFQGKHELTMKNIFWKAYSNKGRYEVIEDVKRSISRFGDIIDFKLFSDISINMTIEIEESAIPGLYADLKKIIAIADYDHLPSSFNTERTIFLNLTFSAATGNLKIETPVVPG